jgi:N-methylhydantoinase B
MAKDLNVDGGMDQLNQALVALPATVRQRRRKDIFDVVLSELPDEFPRIDATAVATSTAHAALASAVENLLENT